MASSYQHLQNRGYSKAQMCLFKILHTISSIPPSQNPKQEEACCKVAAAIDLNLRFCSSESQSSAESETSAIDQENNEQQEDEKAEAEEKSAEVQNFKVENNEVYHVESETASFQGRERESNCLDLLIEATRVLSAKEYESNSGGLSGESMTRGASEGSELLGFDERGIKKQKERWVEPVVRSKRGRNQALPYRFRDSVVEPLKRMSSNPHARNKRLTYNVKRLEAVMRDKGKRERRWDFSRQLEKEWLEMEIKEKKKNGLKRKLKKKKGKKKGSYRLADGNYKIPFYAND